VLNMPFGGADHKARAFVAASVFHRYAGDDEMPEDLKLASMLDKQDEKRALKIGLAARLAFDLSASAAGERAAKADELGVVEGAVVLADGGPQFAPDGKRILFLSGREGSQQVWLADFDPATGATSNAKKLTDIATEADNALWAPSGNFIVFTSAVYLIPNNGSLFIIFSFNSFFQTCSQFINRISGPVVNI